VVSRCVDAALEKIYEAFDASLNPLHSSFAAFFFREGVSGVGFSAVWLRCTDSALLEKGGSDQDC
jgi:hypothetical protein